MGVLDRFPCGRPPRIPDWLRCAVVREAEKELAGFDLEAILKWDLRSEGMSRAEGLARFDQFLIAELLDILRPAVAVKNRSRAAISLAWRATQVRQLRIERGEKLRTRLDELLEDVATR
jgi:hypothetical protein